MKKYAIVGVGCFWNFITNTWQAEFAPLVCLANEASVPVHDARFVSARLIEFLASDDLSVLSQSQDPRLPCYERAENVSPIEERMVNCVERFVSAVERVSAKLEKLLDLGIEDLEGRK